MLNRVFPNLGKVKQKKGGRGLPFFAELFIYGLLPRDEEEELLLLVDVLLLLLFVEGRLLETVGRDDELLETLLRDDGVVLLRCARVVVLVLLLRVDGRTLVLP